MKPKRSYSQVFLRGQKYIEKILSALDVKGRKVVEIGPGEGVISEAIADKAKFLYCVEFDPRFYKFLKEKFSAKNNTEVIHSDILKFSLSKLGKNLIVFGNVPYHISSSIVEYLVKNRACIDKAFLTFQKEFAQKLTAQPGADKYGFITCYTQYYAKAKKIFDIPSKAFWPKPKVDSSFITLDFYKKPPYKVKDEEFLFKIVRKAFSSCRKKVINTLPICGDKQAFFSSLKINPDLRPDCLSLADYAAIAAKIKGIKS